MSARTFFFVLELLALAAVASACGRRGRGHAAVAADSGAPMVAVTEDAGGLLLTWIDDKGDFHVETRVADVPMMGRDTVRVVDPTKDEGSGDADRVFVADLRTARPDGTFPVRTMTRAAFEAIAVARREKTGPTLASAAPPSPTVPAGVASTTKRAAPAPRGAVVIYGASWCGACHEAEKYLRRKGIAFVDKDIEKDPEAEREMQDKLAKNGLRAGSIPVIDVRGKIMVGFDPERLDAALGQAL